MISYGCHSRTRSREPWSVHRRRVRRIHKWYVYKEWGLCLLGCICRYRAGTTTSWCSNRPVYSELQNKVIEKHINLYFFILCKYCFVYVQNLQFKRAGLSYMAGCVPADGSEIGLLGLGCEWSWSWSCWPWLPWLGTSMSSIRAGLGVLVVLVVVVVVGAFLLHWAFLGQSQICFSCNRRIGMLFADFCYDIVNMFS